MLVATDSLTKNYGRLSALSNCTFDVPPGEICGLLGPNGSGKTTLLRLLMGFLKPTSGTATIAGHDCWRESVAVHRRVAYLPGDPRLFRQMRGHAAIRYFSGLRPDADAQRSLAIAATLGLDLGRQVARMSTGMRQILALAVTLSVDAPLLILDEPTSNLDPTVRGGVLEMIHKVKASGRTVIFSSHVLSEVEEVCDRVMILRCGQLVHEQIMAKLRRQHRIHAELTGELPPVPAEFDKQLSILSRENGQVVLEAPGELAPILGWIATLPVRKIRIEPVGLRSIYERYH